MSILVGILLATVVLLACIWMDASLLNRHLPLQLNEDVKGYPNWRDLLHKFIITITAAILKL